MIHTLTGASTRKVDVKPISHSIFAVVAQKSCYKVTNDNRLGTNDNRLYQVLEHKGTNM